MRRADQPKTVLVGSLFLVVLFVMGSYLVDKWFSACARAEHSIGSPADCFPFDESYRYCSYLHAIHYLCGEGVGASAPPVKPPLEALLRVGQSVKGELSCCLNFPQRRWLCSF